MNRSDLVQITDGLYKGKKAMFVMDYGKEVALEVPWLGFIWFLRLPLIVPKEYVKVIKK